MSRTACGVNGSGIGEYGGRALGQPAAAACSGRASPPEPGVPDRPSTGGAPWRGAGATPELPRGQQGAARAQGVRMRMLARVRSTTDALCHTVTHTVAERMPPREACILDAHLQRKTLG